MIRHDSLQMRRPPVHQPPPPTLVAALMRAGVSWDTAMAMERWKAQEVLDLLQHTPAPRGPQREKPTPAW
jgi:hypothetical protein